MESCATSDGGPKWTAQRGSFVVRKVCWSSGKDIGAPDGSVWTAQRGGGGGVE